MSQCLLLLVFMLSLVLAVVLGTCACALLACLLLLVVFSVV